MKIDKDIQIFQMHIDVFLCYLCFLFGAISFKFPGNIFHGKFLCMEFWEVFWNESYKEMSKVGLDWPRERFICEMLQKRFLIIRGAINLAGSSELS